MIRGRKHPAKQSSCLTCSCVSAYQFSEKFIGGAFDQIITFISRRIYRRNILKDIPLYNSRIFKSYAEYVKTYYPGLDLETVLKHSGITSYEIEDQAHWLNQGQADRFHEILFEITGNPELAREAGRFSARAECYGHVRKYILGLLTPAAAYSLTEKLAATLTRGSTFKVRKISHNTVEVISTPSPGVSEKVYQCRNRMGVLESIASIFVKKHADVEHPECFHRGDGHCRYILRWIEPLSSKWRRFRNLLVPVGLLCASISFVLIPEWAFSILLGFVFAFLTAWLWTERTEKQEWLLSVEAQSDAAEVLIAQFNDRYNETQLIREIGQSAARVLPVADLLKLVTKSLGRYLQFDRVLILLADRSGSLRFMDGYGLDPGQAEQLRHLQFPLGPEEQGAVVEAFRKQVPLMLDAGAAFCPARDREFAASAGARDCICIPIVFEKESLGVLIVNRGKSGGFAHSDISLLMGIAPQIASNIRLSLAYRKIQESEERFRSLSENAPDIIYRVDRQGNLTYVNPAWERVLGHPREEVIGKNFEEFVPKELIPEYVRNFKRIRDNGEMIANLDGTMIHRDGTPRYFSLSGVPNLDEDGNVSGVAGIFRDTTESHDLHRKLLQSQKLEAIGTLAGGIAHDFNNLLMGIQGYASIILNGLQPGHPHYEKLRNIEEQVRSGAALTRQMLGFSRGGKYEMLPSDLKEIVEKSLMLFGRTKKQISIHCPIADGIWTARVDRGQIEQVLLNIYVNAWQAMPAGGDLHIGMENMLLGEQDTRGHEVQPGRYIRIIIRDSGTGKDEKTMERIFEPFFTTREKGRGTGLGLAMAYGIIRSHGGFIRVESRKGHGSTFYIYLPATSEGKREQERSENLLLSGRETILVVDDEKPILEVERGMLELLGYRVKCAKSGLEAVRIYKEAGSGIDLVMLDIIMPGLGGIEVLKEIRSLNPDVKVIFSSGYSMDSETSVKLLAEADSFIQKPFTISELSRKVREVLDPAK